MTTRWPHLTRVLLAVALSVTTVEFVELQKLSPDDLRTKFGLPASCDPIVTASTTGPLTNRLVVTIECRAAGKPAVRS